MVDISISRLMSRKKVPRYAKIKEEERLCIEFADQLRNYTIDGKLSAVWHHVPNEGKRHPITALIMRGMGMLPGVADYGFSWASGSGYLEFKAGNNKQTKYQQDFQHWCIVNGVHYEVCMSVDDGVKYLIEWGVIND